MVHLIDQIKRLKEFLTNKSLATLAYFFIKDKAQLQSISYADFTGQESIAAKGYLSVPLTDREIESLTKPGYKGIDIASTIFKLIGGYLASPGIIQKKIDAKFAETNYPNQFLISRCIPSYRTKFKENLAADNTTQCWIFRVLEDIEIVKQEDSGKIATFLQSASDVTDLLMLEELLDKIVKSQIGERLIDNRSVYQIIIGILNNLHNASRKVNQPRRKDHLVYEMNDEYDVQDLLYVVIKSIFPHLKDEDPTPKVGVKSNKIDFILREDGILIETKMIKKSDSDEKKFVEELKNDIQSYRDSQWIRHLIFFVYDPLGKTRDKHNFYALNGRQSINEKTFTIDVIVTP